MRLAKALRDGTIRRNTAARETQLSQCPACHGILTLCHREETTLAGTGAFGVQLIAIRDISKTRIIRLATPALLVRAIQNLMYNLIALRVRADTTLRRRAAPRVKGAPKGNSL